MVVARPVKYCSFAWQVTKGRAKVWRGGREEQNADLDRVRVVESQMRIMASPPAEQRCEPQSASVCTPPQCASFSALLTSATASCASALSVLSACPFFTAVPPSRSASFPGWNARIVASCSSLWQASSLSRGRAHAQACRPGLPCCHARPQTHRRRKSGSLRLDLSDLHDVSKFQ